jgi:hypothetical protein
MERSGVYLGEVSRSGSFNAKGNHEVKRVNRIHDEILAMNQSSWYQPTSNIKVHPYHHQALRTFVEEFPKNKVCGLKDPRLILLLEAWLKIAESSHVLIGSFRHPLAVAKSLSTRNGFGQEQGLDLWLTYNKKLIERHKATPFPIIEYDLTNIKLYRQTVTALAYHLGLKPNRFKLNRFITNKLEHYSCSGLSIPPTCMESYAYLRQHRFSV